MSSPSIEEPIILLSDRYDLVPGYSFCINYVMSLFYFTVDKEAAMVRNVLSP